MKRGGFLAVLLGTLGAAAAAPAHDRSVSYSTWTLDDRGAVVEFAIDTREFTRLGDWTLPAPERDRRIGELLSDSLAARRGGAACPIDSPPLPIEAAPGRSAFRWRVDCLAPGVFEIRSRLFATLVSAHLHFARVGDSAGNVQEALLGAETPWMQVLGGQREVSSGSALVRAFAAGTGHIARGGAHVLFVVGLMLLAASAPEAARLFLAFVVAHSLTLALATLGLLAPIGPAVDALLGLSVAVVAMEGLSACGERRSALAALGALVVPALLASIFGHGRIPPAALAGGGIFAACYLLLAFPGATESNTDFDPAERNPPALRWLMAFVFGLLHGLGFAGILLASRPAPDPLAASLLGFNLGTTAAQFVLLALAWPALAAARAFLGTHYRTRLVEPASVLLLAAGTGWFLARTCF